MDAVLFDLDQTILDRTQSLNAFVLWQARGMLRNSVTDAHEFCNRFIDLDANGTVWKDAVYSALIEEFKISDWSVQELLKSYELCFSGFCKPKPNIVPAIQLLHHEGYKLGVVSNGKSPFQERNFNALGLAQWFDAVVVSESVGCRKPEPEIFHIACDKLGTSAERCVFVGDNAEADILGANNVGMFSVFVPGHQRRAFAEADAECGDFSHLVSIVRGADD